MELVEPAKAIVDRRGETVLLCRLPPEERARCRRQASVAFGAIGMAVQAITPAGLLRIRPK